MGDVDDNLVAARTEGSQRRWVPTRWCACGACQRATPGDECPELRAVIERLAEEGETLPALRAYLSSDERNRIHLQLTKLWASEEVPTDGDV